jgi:hypothetical protein
MRFWNIIERACAPIGIILMGATLYYTIAPYYGWNQPAPATDVPRATAMINPWLLYALGGIGILLLGTAWVMSVLRRKFNIPQTGGRICPIKTGVYVGLISVSIDKLSADLFMEITILGYNGTGKLVSIDGIDGNILYGETKLPTPIIVGDKFNIKTIYGATEFVIAIEQRVPRDIADHILQALAQKTTERFMLSSLNIRASFPPASDTTRLSLWDGITLDQSGRIPLVGRIILLSPVGIDG